MTGGSTTDPNPKPQNLHGQRGYEHGHNTQGRPEEEEDGARTRPIVQVAQEAQEAQVVVHVGDDQRAEAGCRL